MDRQMRHWAPVRSLVVHGTYKDPCLVLKLMLMIMSFALTMLLSKDSNEMSGDAAPTGSSVVVETRRDIRWALNHASPTIDLVLRNMWLSPFSST
mmetsp:Transcript_14702/g.22860  ORF Transcript_14702/g.22860 Transcript_14702/m.22860 type:complete len:95 (+) Transcript_14702:770-1054(+)